MILFYLHVCNILIIDSKALLPYSVLLDRTRNRYGFGAREICFPNGLYSWFFKSGGIIPIERGAGVYQSGMDTALELMAQNRWFHVFSEGFLILKAHSPRKSKSGKRIGSF